MTSRYPENEKFGLTSQLRRASISVCYNLVEG
ncbi:MAG: four helix bundle protein, partial [Bacteroidota bacterium]